MNKKMKFKAEIHLCNFGSTRIVYKQVFTNPLVRNFAF